MWTRDELKTRARFSLKTFYWKSVVAAFILHLIGSGLHLKSEKRKSGVDVEDQIKVFYNEGFEGIFAFFAGLTVVMALVGIAIALVVRIFVMNPLEIGCKRYFLDASGGEADLSNLGYAFRNGYANIAAVVLLRDLSILLWSLLLVVPGIIKAYEYRMIPYLLAEDPEMPFTEAKDRSSIMMQGEKMNAFLLDLSFIGWYILSGITKGIVGAFFVHPYKEFTNTELYKTLCMKS